MHPAILSFLIVIALIAPFARGQAPATQPVIDAIAARTSEFRKENKQAALQNNPRLTAAAQKFAEFMAETGKYGHDADGRQPAERAVAAGYDYCLIRENIAYRFDSRGFATQQLIDEFVNGWINSEVHRKNMLAPNALDIGVGLARSEKGYYYGVQLFGRPESMKIKFTVVNRTAGAVQIQLDERAINLPRGATMTHAVCEPARLLVQGAIGGDVMVDRPMSILLSPNAQGVKVTVRADSEQGVK